MAISEGDILLIGDHQVCLGKNFLNTYTYRATAVLPELTYNRVALRFEAAIIEVVDDVQSVDLLHERISIDNLSNGLDEYTLDIADVGVQPQPVNDLSTAISFTLRRSSKLTRNGGKRIGGLTDGTFNQNVMDVLFQAECDSIATNMASALFVTVTGIGTVGILEPVIVGRFPDNSYDLSRINDVAGVTYHIGASTQVSRKVLS